MTNLENIQQLLETLKTCLPADIGKYFSNVMRVFPYMTNPEKKEKALPFYEWAAGNAETEPLKLAYSEFLLGLSHHLSDDHESGLRFFTKARKCFDELNDKDGQGLCATVTGSIYRTLGNFELALKTSWEGYNLLKQSGNYPLILAASINSMAYLNLELHNYEEAQKFFNITVTESEKLNDYYFRIYALHGLGKVNMHLNKPAEAKVFLEEALQLAETNKSAVAISNSLAELANFYFQTENLNEAEKLNQRALSIREENHLTGAAVTSCINLGEVYIKEARWREAEEILNKGLAIAEQIKVKPKIYRIHFLLSEIYRNQKEFEKSLLHHQLFHNIREQVEQEDNERKLSDAKLIFEAEQTKKENIIIKKQKEEIQLKNLELQETIDELTLSRVSNKAKALTFILAIVLFILQDPIVGFALDHFSSNNYFLSMGIKIAVIFSLSPINKAIEHYLLKRVIKKKKRDNQVLADTVAQ